MRKACVVCGKEFEAMTPAKSCSVECRRKRHAVHSRADRAKDPDRAHEYNRRRYAELSEEQRGRRRKLARKWAETHPEQAHKWSRTHHDEEAERKRNYRVEHLDEARKRDHDYYMAHAKERHEYARLWRGARPGWHREYGRKYQSSEGGKAAAAVAHHNRRVKLNGIPLTADIVIELKTEYGGICPYCNERIIKGHMDHIMPVSKDGTNERNNLVWACAHCNHQKLNMGLLEFLLYRKKLKAAMEAQL